MASGNNNNQRAQLIVTAVKDETSTHKFCLNLPPEEERKDAVKFINERGRGWPSCTFSFSDGNLFEVENFFTLHLSYGPHQSSPHSMNTNKLSVTITYKIKKIPWKINELLESIIVTDLAIPVKTIPPGIRFQEYRVFSSSKFSPTETKDGYCFGKSEALYFEWEGKRELEVNITVLKRAQGSVEIVPGLIPAVNNIFKIVNPHFAQYFLSEQLSDWKIKAGEKEFPAHCFVLKELSGFFERMFSIEMIENETREWKIDDFDADVVEEFLEFAYKGTTKNLTSDSKNTEILKELFRMSHKYDVVDLKVQCEGILKGMINEKNVVDLYQLGFLYESKSLMIAAKELFKRFKLKTLPNGDAIRKLYENYPADMIHELIIK